MQRKIYLKKIFKEGPVGNNIEPLLNGFKSETAVIDFFLIRIKESDMSPQEKDELKEVITESFKEMFEALARQRNGAEILKQAQL